MKSMCVARVSGSKKIKYRFAESITDNDKKLLENYSKAKKKANLKGVLCNENAPFTCISCGKPVYYRSGGVRKGVDFSPCFCHYADEESCKGTVTPSVTKRLLIDILLNHNSFGFQYLNFGCEDLEYRSGIKNHTYSDGIMLYDWSIITKYGEVICDDSVNVQEVKDYNADIVLVRGSEVILISINDDSTDSVVELLLNEKYVTKFNLVISKDLNTLDIDAIKENCLLNLNSYVCVMSPQIYFYNKSLYRINVSDKIICPASKDIVSDKDCVNCPCFIDGDKETMACLGREVVTNSKCFNKVGIFDRFKTESREDRLRTLEDIGVVKMKPVVQHQREVFGVCNKCGGHLELFRCKDSSYIKNIPEIEISGDGLKLRCKDCGHISDIKCGRCRTGYMKAYVNSKKGCVFIGCCNRVFPDGNPEIYTCDSGTLTLYESTETLKYADEADLVGDIHLWANGVEGVLAKVEQLRDSMRKK